MSWGAKHEQLMKTLAGPSAFGGSVQYVPLVGDPVTLSAVFSATFSEPDPQGIIVTTNVPNIGCHLSSLGLDPVEGDQVIHEGVSYRVSEVHLDGEGAVTLMLQESA